MRYSVRIPILVALIVVVLITAVAMVYIQHLNFDNQLMQQVTDNLSNSIQAFNEDFNNVIGQIQGFNENLGIEEDVISTLKENSNEKLVQIKAQNIFKKEYNRLYSFFFHDSIDSFSASFFIAKDMPLAKSVSDAKKIRNLDAIFGGIYNSEGVEDAEWYRATIDNSDGIHMFQLPESPNHVFFAQTIINNSDFDNEFLGVNVIGFDLKQNLYKFRDISDRIAINAFVLDKNKNLICGNTEKIQIDLDEFLEQYNSVSKTVFGTFKTIKHNGKKYMAAMSRMGFENQLLTVVSEQMVRTEMRENSKLYLPAFILEIFVVLLITVILSHGIVLPIKRLANFMVHFEKKLEAPMPKNISSFAEIDELYICYERMRERTKKLLVEAKRSGVKEKEMDFKMLQTQIKPHFIYNALDSIAWLALRKQQHQIANMITALSDSFRYTIKLADDCVSVYEEIAFTKSYIQLQKLHYGERLEYEIQIDESLFNYQTPKFVLQPIVENAIIHGYGREKEKITIFITAVKEKNGLCFFVADDGVGCDIDMLNNFLTEKSDLLSGEKIGIRNVHNRLMLKYDEDYGLSYKINDAGGLTAMIRIPIITIQQKQNHAFGEIGGERLNEQN